jgi:hypothetical protein
MMNTAKIIVLMSLTALAGCIDAAQPILTGGQQLVGARPHFQFYVLRDGAAREPTAETFAWRGDRYVPVRGDTRDIGAFTLHAFEGGDLLVQSLRPGKPVEYALARKLADGTFLLVAVDEADADDSTRAKFCAKEPDAACRVTTRDAVMAFARATAAKPHSSGGLAVLIADR